jgi:hypothetical protein
MLHPPYLAGLCCILSLACQAPPAETSPAESPPAESPPADSFRAATASPPTPATTSPATTSPATTSPATTSPAPSASGSSAVPAASIAAPLLDPDKAKRALRDYRKELVTLCSSDVPIAAWPDMSPPDRAMLCDDPARAGRALASGAFLKIGADEVALDVPSGFAAAAGNRALMVMRHDGDRYRSVGPRGIGKGFSAHKRVPAAGRDLLFVCVQLGNMGYHPSICGFLGQGSFALADNDDSSAELPAQNEIELLSVFNCGEGASVELGRLSHTGSRVHVPLVLERFVREPLADDTGDICMRKRVTDTRMVTVEYSTASGRAVRVSPPFEAVDRIVNGE